MDVVEPDVIEADVVEAEEKDQRRLIRHKALELLARREHSRLELARKLKQRGFAADLASDVLATLEQEDLLSEQRFTESFVHGRMQRGKGPLRIRAELRERGIDDSLLERYLDDRASVWDDHIRDVHRRRFAGMLPETLSERARQTRFLQYRGFTSQQIKALLRGVVDEE